MGDWIGRQMSVTLRPTMPTPLTGRLAQIDASGLLLEQTRGETFVPVTSVLHVTLLQYKDGSSTG